MIPPPACPASPPRHWPEAGRGGGAHRAELTLRHNEVWAASPEAKPAQGVG